MSPHDDDELIKDSISLTLPLPVPSPGCEKRRGDSGIVSWMLYYWHMLSVS